MADVPPVALPIVQQKGGVGKTTVTMNLGYALGRRGARVLVVDVDPQQTSTTGMLGLRMHEEYGGVAEVLGFNSSRVEPGDVAKGFIQRSEAFGCDVLPSSYERLSTQENALSTSPALMVRLVQLVEQVAGTYDFVLFDCPPNLKSLTTAALYAADHVLVVLDAAEEPMEGMATLLRTITSAQQLVGRDFPLAGAVLTKYTEKQRWSRDIEDVLVRSGSYPWVGHVGNSQKFKDAFSERKPFAAVAKSPAEKRAAKDFDDLADNILKLRVAAPE